MALCMREKPRQIKIMALLFEKGNAASKMYAIVECEGSDESANI